MIVTLLFSNIHFLGYIHYVSLSLSKEVYFSPTLVLGSAMWLTLASRVLANITQAETLIVLLFGLVSAHWLFAMRTICPPGSPCPFGLDSKRLTCAADLNLSYGLEPRLSKPTAWDSMDDQIQPRSSTRQSTNRPKTKRINACCCKSLNFGVACYAVHCGNSWLM